jgi:hypothetical protein
LEEFLKNSFRSSKTQKTIQQFLTVIFDSKTKKQFSNGCFEFEFQNKENDSTVF